MCSLDLHPTIIHTVHLAHKTHFLSFGRILSTISDSDDAFDFQYKILQADANFYVIYISLFHPVFNLVSYSSSLPRITFIKFSFNSLPVNLFPLKTYLARGGLSEAVSEILHFYVGAKLNYVTHVQGFTNNSNFKSNTAMYDNINDKLICQ